jgi:hypothetical protein
MLINTLRYGVGRKIANDSLGGMVKGEGLRKPGRNTIRSLRLNNKIVSHKKFEFFVVNIDDLINVLRKL